MIPFLPQRAAGAPLRVLCLGAHSDDIEIGCGGTLLKLAAELPDLEVRWVVFSGQAQRAREARRAASAILRRVRAQHVALESFRDGFFPAQFEAIKEYFERLKREFAPDVIFTHFRDDAHQDHRVVNQLTWNTFRNHCVLEYEIPKYDGDMHSPNAYVEIPERLSRRKAAILLQCFESQRSHHWFEEALFLGLMRLRGMEACSETGYAEGFYVRKIPLFP